MIRKILSDMELEYVYDIHTNFRSRTLLEAYKHLPGGETTATMRLQSNSPGFKGNIQYPPEWMRFVIEILNENDKTREKYLFRKDGGIQNSNIKGRMEQLTCEGNIIEITRVSGSKAFIKTFQSDELPPETRSLSDPRIQKITVVNRLNQLTRSTNKDVYFPLMARPGEELWIDIKYLKEIEETIKPKPKKEIIIYSDYSISERSL